MSTAEEIRGFDKAIRFLSSEITLKVDSLIMNTKSPELIAVELNLLAREIICAGGTLKNLCEELKIEARELTCK